MQKPIQYENTIEYTKVLEMGISYEEYRRAVLRGGITVVRRGRKDTPSLIDANSRYILNRDKLNQNQVSL